MCHPQNEKTGSESQVPGQIRCPRGCDPVSLQSGWQDPSPPSSRADAVLLLGFTSWGIHGRNIQMHVAKLSVQIPALVHGPSVFQKPCRHVFSDEPSLSSSLGAHSGMCAVQWGQPGGGGWAPAGGRLSLCSVALRAVGKLLNILVPPFAFR